MVPRGQDEWESGAATDPHGLTCGVDPTEFAEGVRSAVALAAPTDYVDHSDDDLPESAPRSSRRSRFAKGAVRALVDGFFNTR